MPDRELLPGVEVETDHGAWQVYETPGHAPSHVVLHQPESKLMISGDHLLGRTVLFFDHGHTPDPVGEFLASLSEIEPLESTSACPATAVPSATPRTRSPRRARQVEELHGKRPRGSLAAGRAHAPSRWSPTFLGPENVNSPASAWVLQIVLSFLDHMALGRRGGRRSRTPTRSAGSLT